MGLVSASWARNSANCWVACVAFLCAAPATAVSPEAAVPRTLPGFAPPADVEPGDPLYLFTASDSPRPSVEVDLMGRSWAGDARQVNFGFRNRQIKLIHYATPLRVAQRDMKLKLDAPGAGRSIVAVELVFY